MPADSTATSVPAPMAMPTSAVASAGASLTPSPTIATRPAALLEAPHGRGLVLRQHLRRDLVDAEAPGDRVGDRLRVAGDHRHADPEPWSACDRLAPTRAGPRPRRARSADDAAVDDDVEHRPALARPTPRRAAVRLERRASRAGAGPPTATVASVDHGPGAATGQRLEAGRRAESAAPRSRAAATIARASGCSESRLDGRGEREDVVLVAPRPPRPRRAPARPRVSVPVLSKMTTSSVAGALEREAVLDQQPVPRAERRRDRDDERDREAERMRAGDDEHGRGADERALRVAEQPPRDERDGAGAERDVEQERGRAVGQRLGARLRRLGRRDQPHDPRQRRVVADRRDPDAQAAAGGHRARDDRVARLLGDGRDSPVIIDSSTSAAPSTTVAVGRDAAAGPHEHEVARRARSASGDRLGRRRRYPLGGVGQQLGERGQRAARLGDRAHLEPVAEQHDRDERRELPPDLDLEDSRACPPSWSRTRR